MTRWLRARSFLDRAVAAAAGAVLAPLAAGLGVAIRRHDGGPALVKLTRVGQGGRRFEMWKLRTMRVAGPRGGAGGSPISRDGDDRVTRLGRPLRHWRLDELPQLLNVVRGEMALIGPRPETPEYVDGRDRRWERVLVARPGIAGPTQIAVHLWEPAVLATGDESLYRDAVLPVKLAIDAWYVENASPLTDLLVVVSLVQRFVFNQDVTLLDRRVARYVPEMRRVAAWSIKGDGSGRPPPSGFRGGLGFR